MTQTYTAAEVAKHNHARDLWIVYKDGVYDITKFCKEHPGGEEALLDLAGKDATKCFDDVGHTTEAIQLRETYKIGTVVGSLSKQATVSDDKNPNSVSSPMVQGARKGYAGRKHWYDYPPDGEWSPWVPIFIGISVVLYGYIAYWLLFS